MREIWRWLRTVLSVDRMARELRMDLYRGQPVQWHPKRGLYVVPRRSLRWRAQKASR